MRWLLFDAVHTLIAPREPVAVTYHAAGARHGSQLPVDEVRRRFHDGFAQSEDLSFVHPGIPTRGRTTSEPAERLRWRWVVERVFDDVATAQEDELFTELWQHFADPAAWRVLPDVASTLHALRECGWKLGVASNFDARLDAVLAGLPELPRFDAVLVSSRVGWRKPAPEFYSHAVAACDGVAAEICFVGDSWEHDVIGPRQAGMAAVLLDAQKMAGEDERVRSVAELLERAW
jgi:putative hydrolase of the HAD superfamily